MPINDSFGGRDQFHLSLHEARRQSSFFATGKKGPNSIDLPVRVSAKYFLARTLTFRKKGRHASAWSQRLWIEQIAMEPIFFQAFGHERQIHCGNSKRLVRTESVAGNAGEAAGTDKVSSEFRIQPRSVVGVLSFRTAVSPLEGGRQMAHISFSELRHARGHIGSRNPFIDQDLAQPFGAKLAAHAREMWWNTAFITQIRFAEDREIFDALCRRAAHACARMTGKAVQGCHRVVRLGHGIERLVQLGAPCQRLLEGCSLGIVELVFWNALTGIFREAATAVCHRCEALCLWRRGGIEAVHGMTRNAAELSKQLLASAGLLWIDRKLLRVDRQHRLAAIREERRRWNFALGN